MSSTTQVRNEDLLTSRVSPSLGETFLAFVVLLSDRRRLLLRTTIIFLVIGIVVSLLWPPVYTATTTMLPPQQSASSASSMLAQIGNISSLAGLSGGGSLGGSSSADLYTGFLQSETVENAMINQFGLLGHYGVSRMSQARKRLERHTNIEAKQKSGLLSLSVTDDSPAEAAALANGYVDQCRRLSERLAVSEASQRRLFLEQQLQQSKDKLASVEEDLKRTEERTGVIQVEGQARALIESAATLRAQLAAKEIQVRGMRSYSGEGNSDLMQAEQELAGLRAQLAKLNGPEEGSSGSLAAPKGQITGAGLEYVRALREVKYQEAIFEILARQYESAKLDEAREGAILQVVDPAGIPDTKSGPMRSLIILGAVLAGLSAGVVWIGLADVLGRVRTLPQYSHSLSSLRRSFRK